MKDKIEDHWDTGAIITWQSDPVEEFNIWYELTHNSPDWDETTFSFEDFEDYIEELREEHIEAL